MSLRIAEGTQRINVCDFTVVSSRVSWGTIVSEIFGIPRLDIIQGPQIFRVSTRACNRQGCFRPMIDVKDVVMLSGLVQPSNSTFYSERISHT